MTDHDHTLLSQYLDRELNASETAALERRLAVEPALRDHLQQLQKINSTMQSAFNVPGVDTVPHAVTRLLQNSTGSVVPFPERRRAFWGAAIAASVMAASGLLFVQDTQLGTPSDALLAQALEHAPSQGDGWTPLADGRQVRPVLSFRSKSNGWCREYLLAERGEQWHGVACRGDEHWETALVVPVGNEIANSARDYRPAGASDSDQVQHFVDAQSDDIALSSSAEAEQIAGGWK